MSTWAVREVERRGILLDAILHELERANEVFYTDRDECRSRLLNALGLATDSGRPWADVDAENAHSPTKGAA